MGKNVNDYDLPNKQIINTSDCRLIEIKGKMKIKTPPEDLNAAKSLNIEPESV